MFDIDINTNEIQKKKNKAFIQNLFKEKEVDDLHSFIYGIKNEEQEINLIEDELLIDTQRFDVNPKRLDIY